MNAGDELRLRFPEAPPPARRPRPRLHRRRRRLGEGRRLQHDASRAPCCRCRRTPAAATTRRRGRLEDDPVYRQHPDDFAEYHTRYVDVRIGAARRAARADRDAAEPTVTATMNRTPGSSLAVIFVALLATPLLIRRYRPAARPSPRRTPTRWRSTASA